MTLNELIQKYFNLFLLVCDKNSIKFDYRCKLTWKLIKFYIRKTPILLFPLLFPLRFPFLVILLVDLFWYILWSHIWALSIIIFVAILDIIKSMLIKILSKRFSDFIIFEYKFNFNKIKSFIILLIISFLLILYLKLTIKVNPANIVSMEFAYSYLPFLKYLIVFIFAFLHILLINKNNNQMLKQVSIFWSVILFLFLPYLSYYGWFCDNYVWKEHKFYFLHMFFVINKFVIMYSIDHMALLFLYLTSILFLIIFLYLNNIKDYKKIILVLYIIYFFLINIFTTQNLLVFFFFFESIVYPMFYLIVLGGSRNQKIKAAYYFFFFTVLGSLFMFLSINYLILNYKFVNISHLLIKIHTLDFSIQKWLWFSFFFSFAIKIPMFPFHTWLPEAHVEAPTYGSVLLAGILLKLGIYGMLRILFLLFPVVNYHYADYVLILALISIFYSSIIATRQTDIKRIIAYASIAHMNVIVVGLYSYTSVSMYGALFQSFSHGFVAGGLFFLIGILYDRYKTRIYYYYGGLVEAMPNFSIFYVVLTLANISFPLSSNFIGELIIFMGLSNLHLGLVLLTISSIILGTIYSLWICNRIIFGNLKSKYIYKYKDLTKTEFIVLFLITFFVLLLGIFPNIITFIGSYFGFDIEFYINKVISFISSLKKS